MDGPDPRSRSQGLGAIGAAGGDGERCLGGGLGVAGGSFWRNGFGCGGRGAEARRGNAEGKGMFRGLGKGPSSRIPEQSEEI